MSIKNETYNSFSNQELRDIRNKLVEVYRTPEKSSELPEVLRNHIDTDNPLVGNRYTRIGRCVSVLDIVIINRFMKIKD